MYKTIHSKVNHFILDHESTKNWQIFLGLVIVNLILTWIFQEFVMTREVYHSLLSDRFESYRIDKQLEIVNRFKVWGYLFLPVTLWLKFTIVTLLLQLPLMFIFIEIPFKQIFRVVMLASVSFIIMSLTHLSSLIAMSTEQINENTLKSMPFSLNELVDFSNYPHSAISILNMFNIFEAGWLILVFWGFVIISREKLKKIDVTLLVIGIWSFLLFLQYAIATYMEKAFG